MLNIFHWIGKFIDFFGDKTRTSIIIFILFLLHIVFLILALMKKPEFKKIIHRPLKSFGIAFFIYIVYFILLILKKDFFLTIPGTLLEIDVLLFPMLCGLLILLVLLILNKIQMFFSNKCFSLIGIPICIFGVLISYIVFYFLPLNYTDQGRHAPWEIIAIILLFLILLCVFNGIKNFAKKIKE